MPRPKGSADLLEDRRKRALALLDAGHSLNEVGRRVGCNPSSVMRWRDARRRGGAKALRVRFSPGRPWKLGDRVIRSPFLGQQNYPAFLGHSLWRCSGADQRF